MLYLDQYHLLEIDDQPYLLPYGHLHAQNRSALQLTPASYFLWRTLQRIEGVEAINHEDIVLFLYNHAKGHFTQAAISQEEVEHFLQLLQDYHAFEGSYYDHLLKQHKEDALIPRHFSMYQLGPLRMELSAFDCMVPEELLPFCISGSTTDHSPLEDPVKQPKDEDNSTPTMFFTIVDRPPRRQAGGLLLLETDELSVLRNDDGYVLHFKTFEKIKELRLSLDGSMATCFVLPPYDRSFREMMFAVMRLAFLTFASAQGYYAIHSASVSYAQQAILFSASSGTGKSTQAHLWEKHLGATPLNGDINLLGFANSNQSKEDGLKKQQDQLMVYGIPWCGTSQIAKTFACPLGTIAFLSQGEANECSNLAYDQQVIALYSRFISPLWDKEQLTRAMTFAQAACRHSRLVSFQCTKEETAAQALHDFLFHNLPS